jgi:hypothetical protein
VFSFSVPAVGIRVLNGAHYRLHWGLVKLLKVIFFCLKKIYIENMCYVHSVPGALFIRTLLDAELGSGHVLSPPPLSHTHLKVASDCNSFVFHVFVGIHIVE